MSKWKTKIKNFREYINKGGAVYAKVIAPMSFDNAPLKGKTAIVTGGTSGIGKSIAAGLSGMGANLIITGRDGAKLEKAVEEIPNCKGMVWDVSDVNKSNEMMKKCMGLYGTVDILINNAGIYKGTEIEQTSCELYDQIMDINMKGMYFVTKAFVSINADKPIDEVKKVINILSINSFKSSTSAYSLSKWSALCFTEGLAKEMVSRNIIVNAVAPGLTLSEISENNKRDPNGNLYTGGRNRAHYLLLPEQIANVVKFLASDFSNGMVGQVITVDGGEILM